MCIQHVKCNGVEIIDLARPNFSNPPPTYEIKPVNVETIDPLRHRLQPAGKTPHHIAAASARELTHIGHMHID